MKKGVARDIRRLIMIVMASCILAANLKSFVRMGGLIPGGFTGVTILIQEISVMLWNIEPPFSVINIVLNLIPIIIGFKFIGKKFTGYTMVMIVLTGILTDLIPAYTVTTDILLVAVFGGLINALAVCICLFAGGTTGGTDIISIFFSEKYGVDSWNAIFMGNVVILLVAGYLFGWDKALYSIIFQFTSTQVIQTVYRRYQKQTLLIVTKKPDEVYEHIRNITNHDATLIKGVGCYEKKECDILYSVVGRDEVRKVLKEVHETDPKAFVNMIRTEGISGHFYQKPND